MLKSYSRSQIFSVRTGYDVFWEGRLVPKIHAYDRGDTIEFVLDGRLGWEFPREIAFLALGFAANAMAIGAGYAHFGADKKIEAFAPRVIGINSGEVA